jgi:FkbM family methyltransferase
MLDVTRAYGLTFLFPQGDSNIGGSLRSYGEFARPEAEFISEHLDGTLIDVGANIGAIALPVAAKHPRRRVIAVEGHRGLAGVLAANAINNQLHNVDVIHAAMGPQSGLVQFPTPPLNKRGNFGGLSLIQPEGVMETVRVCSLDEIATEDTRFVKIDVEGYEPEVLAGAKRLIEEVRPTWLFEVTRRNPDPGRRSMAALRAAGYRLFWFWAPFVTHTFSKPAARLRGAIAGDLNVVAMDGESTWGLSAVIEGEPWPESLEAFPYLRRYGL